jgi:hypothetical protein
MTVSAWVGLVIVLVPIGMVLIVEAAVRICLLLFGDEHAERGSRTRSANRTQASPIVSPDVSPSTLARGPGLRHH